MDRSFAVFCVFLFCLLSFGVPVLNAKAPNQDSILVKVMNPLTADPDHNTAVAVVGTTPVEAVTADMAAALANKDSTVQEFVITNKHASQNLCFFTVDYAAQCETGCAAASATCDGTAATDKSLILPLTQRSFRPDGTRCGCLVGSAASTSFSADRIAR